MKTNFKRLLMLVTALLLGSGLRAGWADVKEGMTPAEVREQIGGPLLQSVGHGGLWAIWNYDAGGYVQFEKGVVRWWEPSRGERVKPMSAVPAKGKESVSSKL